MYLVSGISGAKAADMAAVAPTVLPEMKRRGIRDNELVCLLATSSAMSETIPPSLVLITIGSVTGVSIAALLAGGLMPALVLAVALAALARWRARNEDMSKVNCFATRSCNKVARNYEVSSDQPNVATYFGSTKMMSRSTIILSLVYIGSFWASPASAEALTARKQLSLSIAMEVAMEAVAACEQSGYRVAATVVDASGIIKAVAKGDLAPPHTLDSSRGKAYAAVSLGPNFSENTTSAIVTRVVNGPAFGPLQHLAGVFLVAGGVVIKSGDEVIGAVGVGGAPGGDKDEVCAQASVAKITDRLR